jgi:hypothetical protein
VQRRGLGSGIRDRDGHQHVARIALRVVDVDHPVAVVVEDTGVEELVLGIRLAAPCVLGDEVAVRELVLRIVVAPPVPRVARERVEVPPVLLCVLAVVALVAGEPEDPLFQDRVALVPQRKREAEPLLDVGEAGEAVLAPAIRTRARMVVRQVLPRRAAGAVVLADRSPLTLAEIRPPRIPVAALPQAVLEVAERLDPVALRTQRT